jgi:hypothetical protein
VTESSVRVVACCKVRLDQFDMRMIRAQVQYSHGEWGEKGGTHVLCVELQESSQYKIKSILKSEKDSGSTSLALPIASDL